jgi:hypothetical protein
MSLILRLDLSVIQIIVVLHNKETVKPIIVCYSKNHFINNLKGTNNLTISWFEIGHPDDSNV